MRTLNVRNRVLPTKRLPLLAKNIDVLSDETFTANHQTIHKVTHTLSIDAGNFESSFGFFLDDSLRDSRLPRFGGHGAAVVQQAAVLH